MDCLRRSVQVVERIADEEIRIRMEATKATQTE